MKTLPEIATPKEIAFLLNQNLITEDYLTMFPYDVREGDRETQLEYCDGLIVSIRDAVEPAAWWKE